ncbi:MAG: type I 3-dehydroquinate dehydratase [Candidatus Nitrosocosmicus sp.]|nr:type I 3-dehydroquinate dehydratase [Candidatus Nitrosocosmicus sp.]MDN5865816.1 type I 3-dehydroquinate dehydratase [Candidatus Nitrosocosmicus sp.]
MSTKRKLCASIPVAEDNDDSKNLESTLNKINEALNMGADIIECRFDYLRDFENLDHYLDILSKYKDKCIYTIRPENEGGKFPNDPKKRAEIIDNFIHRNPFLVDIEYNLISSNDLIADLVENENPRILVSWHDFLQTPEFDYLLEQVKNMQIYSPLVKIVTTAKSIDDSIKILSLNRSIDTHINLVAFAMGEMGVLSRVLCTVVGDAPFTYASLGAAIAPGQLSIDQMKSIYDLFKSKLV